MASDGSIISGADPLANPLTLFLVQACLIILLSRLLGVGLAKIRQPKVIAEVIGGILLGPSVFGQIPGFTENIFPESSMEPLKTTANLGLIFFLFLVGLELDVGTLRKNFKQSVGISLAGIIVPFVCGIGVSFGLYTNLQDGDGFPSVSYILFLGVAMSITAFPVLARILSETKLLQTPVGLATIAAAGVDDAIAWCLLALVIALINAGDPLVALYVFLVVVGYTIFLFLAVKPIFNSFVERSSNKEHMSQFVIFLTFLMILASAFFTEAIGVHAIFGAFLIGIIIPHESGFAIQLTEKIEDFVSILLLPLYFAVSGLSVNLGLINSADVVGWMFLVIFVACAGKITGCTLAGRVSGLKWRESLVVGVLMNTKGLVELIVLNLGLERGVINDKVFAVMVVMALVTTFMTTPLVTWLYPPSSHSRPAVSRDTSLATLDPSKKIEKEDSLRILVTLHNMQTVPCSLTFMQMLQGQSSTKLEIHALRLIELSERTSSIMKATESITTMKKDPIINVFRTFGQLNKVGVKTHLNVSHMDEFSINILDRAGQINSNLILIPWLPSAGDHHDAFWFQGQYNRNKHRCLIDEVLERAPCSVAILLDRGFAICSDELSETSDTSSEDVVTLKQQVIIPFVGGADDREALLLCLLFANYRNIQVRLVHIKTPSPNKEIVVDEDVSGSTDTIVDLDKAEDERVIALFQNRSGSYEEVETEDHITEIMRLFKSCGRKDMVVVGMDKYSTGETLADSPIKLMDFVDEESHCSTIVVQKHGSQALH